MMDKRTLRFRKGKSRNGRPYDRQNQCIFCKVCSTVKGLLNPSSWFNVSNWIPNSEEHGGPSDDVEEESENINNDADIVSQSVSNASKRLRLRLEGHNFPDGPSIQSSETQTWPEQPSQNLYEPIRIVSPSSSATQTSLLENKEVMAVMNGDDHSENSEGSASTSGCSSLVSSHKESNRIAERPFVSLLDVKSSRKRRDMSPKSDYNDLNSSRGLWSTSFNSSLKFQRRYPTVSHTNQPNFNLSSFAGPSRLSESSEKKTSSPFYEGKTTFGGASALRRMPASVVPYQVDRSLRNQIRVREQNSEDNLKRMSSAAERILLTLDKISSPVSDAKKIPNSDNSPVDLSIYLTPAKSRWNSQLTPPIASKGPPIANINTIAKLATLKNYGTSRLRSTPLDGSITSAEQKSSNIDVLQSNNVEISSQKSCGGKMKTKLNQHHFSSKQGIAENEVIEAPSLKSIPLPITSLPTINFGPKPDRTVNSYLPPSGFTFSKPIEHDLSVSSAVPTSTFALHSPYDSFKFAHPIDYELPNNSQPKEIVPCSTWECSACWVRNPQARTSCLACETSRETKETKKVKSSTNNEFWECTSCWVRNPIKENKCMACEYLNPNADSGSTFKNLLKPQTTTAVPSASQTAATGFNTSTSAQISSFQPPGFGISKSETESVMSSSSTTFTFGTGVKSLTKSQLSTWECPSCWVRNPKAEKKCMACEFSNPSADSGFTFKSLEKTPATPAISSASQTAPTGLNASTSAQVSSFQPLVFGTSKSEATGVKITPSETFTFGTEVKSSTNNESSTWECTTCWVRNPMKEKKCMACETLHPNTDSAIKGDSGFKFSSPIQNSPIAFKFGNFVCTVPSTVTTPTFKFGIVSESQTTTTNSSIKFAAPDSNTSAKPIQSITVSKSPETTLATTHSSVASGFKMPDVTLNSEKTQNVSTSDRDSQTKNIFALATKAVEPKVSESKNSCVTKKTEDTVIKEKELAPEPEKNNSIISKAVPLTESSKEKLPDTVISSNVPNPSVTSCFGFTSKPIEVKDTKENKLPIFKLSSETPALSAFSSPTNLFKFGEKMNSPKNNLPATSATLPIVTTATTTASFSFSGSGVNFGNVKNSVNNEVTSAASNNSLTIKTEENKTVASTAISSVTTSIPFVFGSSANTSASSGFSFFPTSSSTAAAATTATSTTASTVPTSIFAFGASSNQSGGFTFKGLEKPQTTSAVSSAPTTAPTGLNTSTSAPASSFLSPVFGTPKSEVASVMSAPPVTFTFGAGSTTVSSTAPAFSTFQPSQSGNPSFQFGSQIPGSTTSTTSTSANFVFSKSEGPNSTSTSQNTVSVFGSTAPNFVFGAKSETSNQISGAVSQPSGLAFGSTSSFTFSNKNENSDAASQKPLLPFGSSTMPAMPVFGNTSVQPSFDGQDKAASGGFNFGTSSSSVFQFGAGTNNTDKKRTATASGFSFGTPSTPDTNANSFPTGFSINTPLSFNFGASSTPAGPFQFAASGAAAKPASTANAGPRKIRKAVRRVNRGKD